MKWGINVDPVAIGDTDTAVQMVRDCGATFVVTVLIPDNQNILVDFFGKCRAVGIETVGVIAYESGFIGGVSQWDQAPSNSQALTMIGLLVAGFASSVDHWVVGNEPDLVSDSSWTLTVETIDSLLTITRVALPNADIWGPGLASGQDFKYDVSKVNAVTYHVYQQVEDYNKTPSYGPMCSRVIITEYATDVDGLGIKINQVGGLEGAAAFCLSQAMVPEYGIIDTNGNTVEPRYSEFKELSTMSEFNFGFKDYAAAHPEVGSPVTDEAQIGDAQITTNGLLVYITPPVNQVVFIPFR